MSRRTREFVITIGSRLARMSCFGEAQFRTLASVGVDMKTQYYSAMSLDGYIATEDHGLDWLMQFEDMEGSSYPDFIRDVGAVAMGASTYEWLLRHHVKPGTPDEAAWPYEQPVWVFTHRELTKVKNADLRWVQGDVRPVHRDMAAAANRKNVWIAGGGELAGQFYDAGLLDELILQIAAVTLCRGLPLLPRKIVSPPLQLTKVATFGKAFVELRYDVPKS